MDGANADSDNSMTWEDFFGSTTDLAPTLLGIYDSLLQPADKPNVSKFELTAKDARTDPPLQKPTNMTEHLKTNKLSASPPKDSRLTMQSGIATINKSSLYTLRNKINCDNGATDTMRATTNYESKTVVRTERRIGEVTAFDTLSPNVKRMISSASETTTNALKFKKTGTPMRASGRGGKSNIPLIGATSKITQSRVEVPTSVQIYDQPSIKTTKPEVTPETSPAKTQKPEFILNVAETYDVPKNNKPAFTDANKTAFESLSLPYIDQSIEMTTANNDREFDVKISPKKETEATKPESNGGSLYRNLTFKSESPKHLGTTGPYPETIGSTGNLKTILVVDKDPVKLNPPSVEVSRPLSMSSITSSSSTSSSGVQNKGVNSAYLASIESLDDHSDVDTNSATGSNNFVSSTGVLNNGDSGEARSQDMPNSQPEELSGLSQLERVCAEIVHTENVYVQDLQQVVEGYLHVWRREGVFSEEELAELFNNIEDIYHFNRTLRDNLNTCRLDGTSVARAFLSDPSGFNIYASYCTGYPRTMHRLAELAASAGARACRDRQVALGHPLPLSSYLLKPVQRILKYHLLMQKVVKQCATPETELALLKMTGIAQHIDDMKRKHEHAVRVQEIQSLLYGWNGSDLTTYGELCAEGTFRVFGAKAMRHAFLFDQMLLVTKHRGDGVLAYKTHIMCNNMMLVEAIAGAPLSFHVIPWDAPRCQLTLQARSPRHKREWTLLLKRVILENYNAVIPSHARQLVMELGQNKTDDDILAEKSHNLITQASMRKQLSAPEYLEKRKIERERRKTCDTGLRSHAKKNARKISPVERNERNCDCAQVSAEKGIDYTCDHCYVDLCSDCEAELGNKEGKDKCNCKNEDDKCAECDRSLHYIDSGSAEHIERKTCKCSDFQSSQESFGNTLNITRGYHSSDNIVGYTDKTKSKEDLSDSNVSISNIRNIQRTCLKCCKIKENIPVTEPRSFHRKSRRNNLDKSKADTLRSKSKDDPHRSKLSKIGTWRRKSEPGLQQNVALIQKKVSEIEERQENRGAEKIEFECRNCGTNKINKRPRNLISDPEVDRKRGIVIKPNVEIKMYNTKTIPKKISKIKKNRAKAKFYADLSTDVSAENILHISESNDSLNTSKGSETNQTVAEIILKDDDIDEETYKKLIEKTDSFKKNELEKVKFLNKQKVINEGSEAESDPCEAKDETVKALTETEQPLEQIISQLLLQNREFQKLLKKQQQRNSAHRRHQRLLKSHSNPEPPKNEMKLRPKYTRQLSENSALAKDGQPEVKPLSPPNEVDDEHIYETLRVDKRNEEAQSALNDNKCQMENSKEHVQPNNVSMASNRNKNTKTSVKDGGPESDYVYLTFDELNKLSSVDDTIYDVPVKTPKKVQERHSRSDYYVTIDKIGPIERNIKDKDTFDGMAGVPRRVKEVDYGDYLPMSGDQQSPVTPEIWLSRQKEHFNVSRDRKSGSLPRSFQVITSGQEPNENTLICKPNTNNKTYLNRDGKVMSTDRPYTIASDQSEISYDDENYNTEGFNKSGISNKSNDSEQSQIISQSTLELEKEIDRCYKNNFGDIDLDAHKKDNLLNVSQPNLNVSTSSCEVLTNDKQDIIKEAIHPEHKIYKPTSNMLSLKNVLSRFKNRNVSKSVDDSLEPNANDQSSPETNKNDLKSPTNEKKSSLNPKSYSKNLLQRFKNIIGDETDDNQNRSVSPQRSKKSDDNQNLVKREIKVVITSTDNSPTTSTIVYTINNDALSKSVCDTTTLSESQNEMRNLDPISTSCINISEVPEIRPTFVKSVSVASSTSTTSIKSNSTQSINKLPVYMQGSKHLGARIAQCDYVDPTTLKNDRNSNNINVLINKNAVRPDSLFSLSSFVTSSSEGTYQEPKNIPVKVEVHNTDNPRLVRKPSDVATAPSDDSYYEKSFEKIEQLTDSDIFRDSAVYSDQEDSDEVKANSNKTKNGLNGNKTVTHSDTVNRESSFKTQKVILAPNVTELRTSVHSRVTVTSKVQSDKVTINDKKTQVDRVKPKIAPPVPAKPKLTQIPTTSQLKTNTKTTIPKNDITQKENQVRTLKRPVSLNQTVVKSDIISSVNSETKAVEATKTQIADADMSTGNKISTSNIQLKRLSFERASLDSSARRSKPIVEPKKPTDSTNRTKSVLERRLEIESITKTQTKPGTMKKPSHLTKPKYISTKVAKFERSVSDVGENRIRNTENVEVVEESADDTDLNVEKSWVKSVVNKFQ